MKARAVVRTSRRHGISYADADRVIRPSRLRWTTLERALGRSSSRTWSRDDRVKGSWPLHGASRHCATPRCAAGVVIAPRPLTEFDSSAKSQKGRNRHAVGDEGSRADGPPQDGFPRPEHAHPHPRRARRNQAPRSSSTSTRSTDRAKTFQLFCEGQTYGVFQFESSGCGAAESQPEQLDD